MKLVFRESSRFEIDGNMTSVRGKPPGVCKTPVKGEFGTPKSSFGRLIFLKVLAGKGEPETGGKDARFDGVSGIWYTGSVDTSMFLLRFEITPVDINAFGLGRANLYRSGVSKEFWES